MAAGDLDALRVESSDICGRCCRLQKEVEA